MRIKLKPFINELLIQIVIKRNFLNIIKTLLGCQKKLVLPDYSDPITLASTFNMYFIDKIANIRAKFPLLESSLPPYSFGSMDSIMPTCGSNDSRLHVVEPPRRRSFIWQIGVNSSIQDRRQVDRGFLWSRVSCTRQR